MQETASIRNRIQNAGAQLTLSERKLVAGLLADYPFAGLRRINDLSAHVDVSTASISRFTRKLGFAGYQRFQDALLNELRDQGNNAKHLMDPPPSQFTDMARFEMEQLRDSITENQFLRVCALLADARRDIYIVGGRVSDLLARFLSFHLRQIRKGVFHLPENVALWPEYLLRMQLGDVVLTIDFAHYQNSLATFCRRARHDRNVKIILMTDAGLSPIAKSAAEVLAIPTGTSYIWNSYVPALAIIETIAHHVAQANWSQAQQRIQAWNDLRFRENAPSTTATNKLP